ncbi:MAG: diphosphomevalonate decarboxylase [Prolixibacteraceae bacterium]
MQSCWSCPSNIALVKYWGKREGQLPLNPSLSFSLKEARTTTRVVVHQKSTGSHVFLFEGKPSIFSERIENYLCALKDEIPWISRYAFHIESTNTFPHSAGIASSASAFGALALCLADLDRQFGETSDDQFYQRASQLARMGSGSAARSVYPGFSWWGYSPALQGSSDEYAIPVNGKIFPGYSQLRDAVLLVDSAKKSVSSSAGHQLMENHPYRDKRIEQANVHAEELLRIMQTGRYDEFFQLVEQEAFSLHALMMSSVPPYLLLKPNSIRIIEKIRDFRNQSHLPVGLTIDAGPNIHLLYLSENRDAIQRFIETELLSLTENRAWLDDRIGDGPVKVE